MNGTENSVELRDFTADDWMGLNGCERFSDGSEPLIAHVRTPARIWEAAGDEEMAALADAGETAAVVFDRNGAYVSGIHGGWFLDRSFATPAEAREYFNELLDCGITLSVLKIAGFKAE